MAGRNKRLKVAIANDGRTQRQLALDAGIKENRLSNLVAGAAIPRPDERSALARELDTTEAALFDLGEDAAAPLTSGAGAAAQ